MPTTGTTSAATGVISMVLFTAVVALGILVNRRVRLPYGCGRSRRHRGQAGCCARH
jgi:hypothetical protein